MSDFLHRLVHGPRILLDGGLGSELIARGLPAGACPDLWTLDRPEEVCSVHRGYAEAGSDAIHANTFGANAARLACFGLADRIEEINRTAVDLARRAGAPYVIADVGPTGEYLPPVGHGDRDQWRRHFIQQGKILAGTGIDAFHIETMTDLREALVALEALQEAAPEIPVLASLTFERKKRGFFTIMGDPLGPSLARLWEAGAVAVGANCTIASGDMRDLARSVLASTNVPLVFQPNAGVPEWTDGPTRYAQDPEEFAEDLSSLLSEVRVVALGGCCGTDPRFIAALRVRMSCPQSR
jgi:methionine synthase I (cobalamin-dependent)